MIRATTPDGGHVGVDAWPRTVAPGATVSLDVASTHLPHCAVGAAALVEGPVELRREANKFGKKTGRWKGTGGVSFAVHDAAGAQCGYVANADMELVAEPSDDAPVAARVVAAGGGKWTLVAPETLVEDAVIDEAWTLEAKIDEIKSKNDSLWTEQRMWIRALTERDFLHYENPYLFYEDGSPAVRIATTRVAETRKRAREAEPEESVDM
mmetsp:Transcript_26940/g.81403  ORF Transcript_26940/g.81403 Transcript_26940/m.81403 type:complete len:210 (-) Transcript_26940:443-1072(-)